MTDGDERATFVPIYNRYIFIFNSFFQISVF